MAEKEHINWKQVVITVTVTGLVTLLGGLAVSQIQEKEPHLSYSVLDALPFEGPSENIAIYYVKIENGGKSVVEDVVCCLTFSKATIQQSNIRTAPAITFHESIENNTYKVELSHLNPKESFTISILATSPGSLPLRPEVSLRGKGVTGVEISEKEEKPSWTVLIFSLIALSGAFAGLGSLKVFRKIPEEDSTKHSDDQRQILSYLCGIHNLDSDAESYLRLPEKVSYWSEADRFAMLAIKNPQIEDTEKRKQVLIDLLKYAEINPASEGIIHYNIARIAKAQGNETEAESHLKEAEKIIPELLKTRYEIDPIWKRKIDSD